MADGREIDYEYLLNNLETSTETIHAQPRTPPRTAASFVPQQTRSGRIPQRPASTTLDPLDFLDFPDESESDDPDFDPLNPPPPSSSNVHSPKQATQNHSQSQLPCFDLFSQLDPTGFDFSTLSDQPQPIGTSVQQNNFNHQNSTNNPFNQFQFDQTYQFSPKLSPLTQGEIAGVPFVNINLPESDDSPEFIPPPTTRSSAAAAIASSSSRLPKRPRREVNARSLVDPSLQPSSSTCTLNPPANTSSKPTSKPALPSAKLPAGISKLPAAISSRYVAIAPSPNYPHTDRKSSHGETIHNSDDSEGEESEQLNTERTLVGTSLTRSKPAPKRRKTAQSLGLVGISQEDDVGEGEDPIKRKRECMRKTRERKKIYIVSLEDRCLELAEENARLREENEELMRESRENWKAKAKSLEVFKLLNQQIQRLQGTTPGGGPTTRNDASSRKAQPGPPPPQQRARPVEQRIVQKRKLDTYQSSHYPNSNNVDAQRRPSTTSLLPSHSAPFSNTSSKRPSFPPSSSSSSSSRFVTQNSSRGRTLLDVLSAKSKSY
ncbi:hypothetical protein PCANC_02228 [Puccinia coronata f. sp. avenae]|uniref:BZIP domain-containing protein n=1 Tax=Puccinia coronata f. sp. avenae TaxID=200324 RepID=A0A2N5SP28_9BASI|nr:hypothetical protein PCASD_18289 [Puccinia coronata f. sp. avenae]PLW31135.1 hypothetical protein PCASD_12446 [Puccinia coronata f. sp. avenae]PLW55868.1 hypothetical protein PCANC_02228 [Puccinia coronata f. sp. avenae]